MDVLFWISVAGILGAYAGYPAILILVSVFFGRRVRKSDECPSVSILIAAHNEEASIAATIRNKLALDYPGSLIEIIVISDGSTDRTEEIVRGFGARGVHLLVQETRQGKTAGLNRAVTASRGDILIFSDANSMYDKDVVTRLVANFSDASVGYVTGKMVYVDQTGSLIGSGCSAYMRYENVLRDLETRVGSVVGVDGGVDAIRRSLYEPMRADLLPDFILPLRVVQKGFRVVYEPGALLMESTLTETSDEIRMRVRVILRSFHALWYMRALFNPLKTGLFSFQLFAHKVLRYLVGVLQITAILANAALVGASPSYAVLFGLQALFYALAAAGFVFRKKNVTGLLRYPYYLCLLNGAALVALWKFFKGESITVWKPRKG